MADTKKNLFSWIAAAKRGRSRICR